jgi:hypothetical protein
MEIAHKAMPWLRMPRILEDGEYALTTNMIAIRNLAKIKNKSAREEKE